MKDWAHNGMDWERLAELANYKVVALACVSHQSRRSLHRYFIQRFGLPPREWLDSIRLRRAKALLLERHPVKAVAYSVGFRQENNFYPFFRRHTGQTPSEFLASSERRASPLHVAAPTFPPGCLGGNWGPDNLVHSSRFTDSAQLSSEHAPDDWSWGRAFGSEENAARDASPPSRPRPGIPRSPDTALGPTAELRPDDCIRE